MNDSHNHNYKILSTFNHIRAKNYIESYRETEKFYSFCEQCRNFGKTYACPPFDFDVDSYIKNFEDVFVVGTKIVFDAETKHLSTTVEKRDVITKSVTLETIKHISVVHDSMLEMFPQTISFLVGECYLCHPNPCKRLFNEPCAFPEKVRHSIESVGFDVGKTAKELLGIELQWSRDYRLPDYLTIVTALFTNEDKEKFSKALSEKLNVADSVSSDSLI